MADIELGSIEIKTGENTSEEIKIPASSVSGLAKVATSGLYDDLSNKPTNYVTTNTTQTISGNKIFTAQPTINTSDGLKFTSGNCALRIYNTNASPTDYSAIEVRSNSSTKRNLFIDLDINSLVVGKASGTADTTYKVNVKDSLNATTIYENGTPLTNKYLGKTAKAADADKLDGNDSSYYLNYDNLDNKPSNATTSTPGLMSASDKTKLDGIATGAKGTITGITMNGESKGTSDVVDLGTVLTDASKFATSAQGMKADNAMPKAGGAFMGAVTVQAPTAEMNPATKQYVDTAINAVKQFEYQVVTELPTAAQATMGKIYLVAHSHNPSDGKPDSYDEFITVQSGSTYKWERIGNTDIDLSGYVPTTRKINNKALSSDITLYPTDVGVTEANFPGLNKTGTVTGVMMNGATKNPSSGVVDIGTVLTDESKFATSAQGTKADNAMPKSGDTFTGPVSSKSYYKSENADLRTSTTLSHIAVRVDNGRTNSHTAYMNGQINIKSASSSSEKTITIPDKAGTIALTSDILDGTLTIQKNGETVGTFTANQSSSVTANITVPTKASDVNALSLDGGTINKSKTIKMDASANSDGANLKWGTVNHKNPYIGYASDQSDGTFVIGSLLGTNYASGLAIGGGSGNLLWIGTKVATTSDIPNIVQSTGTSTSSVMSQNATTNAISGKLDKTTYEVNKTINFGSSGILYVGKFKVYDTNVTCEVTSTTDVTYSGKLVIATQNYVIKQMTVYGDAANTVAPNFFIKPSTTSDPYVEVYFKPSSWSKNIVHIYGSEIKAEPTNVCTNVPAVPSTATSKPTNALNSKANVSDLPIKSASLSGTTLYLTL